MSEDQDLTPAPADATPADMDSFMEAAFDDAVAEDPTPEIKASEPAAEDPAPDAVAGEEDAGPETDTPEGEADEAVADEPVEEQTITAPQSMSAKDREAFEALPPESQQWLTDRAKEQEASLTKKSMELAEQRKGYEKLDSVLAPRRQQLAMDGMDDGTAVGQLFALSDFANNDPVGFVKYMLNARNIPITALTESDQSQGQVDPQLAAMQQKLQGFENHFTQQQHNQQQQAEKAISGEVDAFATANEHYTELENDMIPLVAALRQSTPGLTNTQYLEKAYKMAIATNEGVSAKVAEKAEAARITAAKAKANAAKKGAGANTRTSGTRPAAKGQAANVEDFIGSLVDERMRA